VRGEARIAQISISAGGGPKRSVQMATVTRTGIEGDGHKNLGAPRGPGTGAVSLLARQIRALRADGHPIVPGSIGENVTVEGLDWSAVRPGARLWLGKRVLVEVTRYTTPCTTISRSFADGDSSRVSEKRHPGWSRVYARVMQEGLMRVDDPVRLLPAE
jgi:MOSC domain-containing protein YiiM